MALALTMPLELNGVSCILSGLHSGGRMPRPIAFIVTIKRGELNLPEAYYIHADNALQAIRRAARIANAEVYQVIDVRSTWET
jgi:hypothetical protein